MSIAPHIIPSAYCTTHAGILRSHAQEFFLFLLKQPKHVARCTSPYAASHSLELMERNAITKDHRARLVTQLSTIYLQPARFAVYALLKTQSCLINMMNSEATWTLNLARWCFLLSTDQVTNIYFLEDKQSILLETSRPNRLFSVPTLTKDTGQWTLLVIAEDQSSHLVYFNTCIK